MSLLSNAFTGVIGVPIKANSIVKFCGLKKKFVIGFRAAEDVLILA